jgi:large subunit ribosomal protein L23
VRSQRLSPYHARFLVPLDFSKYDLRDYLYHAYAVKCFNIRSVVKQMYVRDTREQMRHWFRPDSEKYMTVEMEQPFVWPGTPRDLQPWGGKKEPTKKTLTQRLAAGAGENAQQQRTEAYNLRQQVEQLFNKRVFKKDLGIDGEKRTRRQWKDEQAKTKKESAVNLWERKRTQKVATLDAKGKYVIKA